MFELMQIKPWLTYLGLILVTYITYRKSDKYIKRTLIEHVVVHRQSKRLDRLLKVAMIDKQTSLLDMVRALKSTGVDLIMHRIISEAHNLKLDYTHVARQLNQLHVGGDNIQWEGLWDGIRLRTTHGHHDYRNPDTP